MLEYQKIVGSQFLTYTLKRGESGLIERYVRNPFIGANQLDERFYSYDYAFFNTMDDASLWLNAFEAAYLMGESGLKRVYFMLSLSEAQGNAFRNGEGSTIPLFYENDSLDRILTIAKSYGVKYL